MPGPTRVGERAGSRADTSSRGQSPGVDADSPSTVEARTDEQVAQRVRVPQREQPAGELVLVVGHHRPHVLRRRRGRTSCSSNRPPTGSTRWSSARRRGSAVGRQVLVRLRRPHPAERAGPERERGEVGRAPRARRGGAPTRIRTIECAASAATTGRPRWGR